MDQMTFRVQENRQFLLLYQFRSAPFAKFNKVSSLKKNIAKNFQTKFVKFAKGGPRREKNKEYHVSIPETIETPATIG